MSQVATLRLSHVPTKSTLCVPDPSFPSVARIILCRGRRVVQVGCKRGGVMYLHGGVVRSHRPELLWPHVRTCLSTPS